MNTLFLAQAVHAVPARVINHVAPSPVEEHTVPAHVHTIGADFWNFIRSVALEKTVPVPVDECIARAPEVHSPPTPVVELEEVRRRIKLRREAEAALAERASEELLKEEKAAHKPKKNQTGQTQAVKRGPLYEMATACPEAV